MKGALAVCGFTAALVVLTTSSGEAQPGGCTISATGVAFGNYDVLVASPLDSTGSITYRCTNFQLVFIEFSTGSSGTFTPRTMRLGVDILNYNLYRDAARTNIWGDNTGGTSRLFDIMFPNVPQTATVYGRIPPLQNARVGAYSDTLTVTMRF